jgi:hypothetical protein
MRFSARAAGGWWRETKRTPTAFLRRVARDYDAKAAVAAAFDRFVSILGPEARRGLGRVLVSDLAQTRTPGRFTLHRSRPELNANFGYLPVENREPGSARFARRTFYF